MKKQEYKYSIVIPVYNSEKTIGKCLDSLLSMDRDDIQILLINDGSSDRSDSICSAYADKNKCIYYLTQTNKGVSAARNAGLEEAEGSYVSFVDSDDYVTENYFKVLDKITADSSVDFAMFGVQHFGNRNLAKIPKNEIWENDKKDEIICYWLKTRLLNSLWSKLFKRQIIEVNHMRFDEDLSLGEDLVFNFEYSMHAQKVMTVSDMIYYVNEEGNNSLSRGKALDLSRQTIKIDALLRNELNSACVREKSKKQYLDTIYYLYYRGAYSSIKKIIPEIKSSDERARVIKEICDEFKQRNTHICDFKTFIVSIPIKCKMSWLIELIMKKPVKYKYSSKYTE